jgi:hypothetical protein
MFRRLCSLPRAELWRDTLSGHASVLTTERYLGSRQNLAQAVNDHLPLEPD